MKKILFVSPTGTLDNGAEISIFNFMKYLVQQGNTVYTVVPQHFNPTQSEYYKECDRNGIYAHFIPSLKWWWEDAPGGLAGTAEERAFYHRDNIKRIRAFIQENEIELVITNTVNMFQGAVAAACENIPHFWLIHEFPAGEFSYYLPKISFIANNSDRIYVVQGELRRNLQELFSPYEIKTFVPFTEPNISSLKSGKKRRIVSVGRLTERKNQLELIKAFQQIDDTNLELVFIGHWDESYKKKCNEYIKINKVKNVSFLGNAKNPWELFTDNDICVLPSAMETFGLVYVEALLNGIPVIFSNNPGFLSAYEIFNFGHQYPVGDVATLAKTIINVSLNFPSEREAAQKFSGIAQSIYQIENVYSEILKDIANLPKARKRELDSIANVLSLDEPKSKMSLLMRKIKVLKSKGVNRLKRYL